MSLTDLTISEASALIAAREITVSELTRAHLERITRLDPILRAFITLADEAAMLAAELADAAIARGTNRGLLHGIPMAHKDLFETRGIRTTAGSKVFADHVPGRDAAAIARLNDAGAILLGKLNMHELAFGVVSDNPFYGRCLNPYDLARLPGGSSGGSAAALAARLCMASLGSDTRGSIRIPAALCGVVGLKPTYGRISLRGVIPLGWNLDHAGPMARTVRDVALLLSVLAGYDPDEPYSIDEPVSDYLEDLDGGVKGWRVAVAAMNGGYFTPEHEALGEAVREAGRVLADLGAQVHEVDIDWLAPAGEASRVILGGDAAALHWPHLNAAPDDFSESFKARLRRDSDYSARVYAEARHLQTVTTHQLGAFFADYDLLIVPATPLPAIRHDELDSMRARGIQYTRFTAPFNVTGVPAVSLPGGFTADGLPIGVQFVAPHWTEAQLLRAGAAFEAATGWHRRKPPL